ncbi:cytochrome P450 [Mycena vitilis]|nr:cytochrome P450 [Mycena vitilis]
MGSEMDVYDILLEQEQSNKRRNTLTADEIAAQTGIILVGGQDTTANTMALGLVELARNPEFQQDLRSEILSARGGAVEYDSMPLLNAFIKVPVPFKEMQLFTFDVPWEVLRLYPTGPLQERAVVQDTVIPLADGLKTPAGEVIHEVRVSKGHVVVVAVASYHRLTSPWGEDAHQFKPSRWIDGPVFSGHAVGP